MQKKLAEILKRKMALALLVAEAELKNKTMDYAKKSGEIKCFNFGYNGPPIKLTKGFEVRKPSLILSEEKS